MSAQPHDVTPADAMEAYRGHEQRQKRRRAEEFFEVHKSDGILADLHRGIHLLRAFDWRIIRAQSAAAAFVKDLSAGAFAGLSLATQRREAVQIAPGTGGLGSAALPACAADTAPHFLADVGRCSMVFGSVDASLSAWDLLEVLQQKPGFVDAWLVEPSPPSLLREGRALFESDAHLETAIDQLRGTTVKGYTMRPVRALPPESHPVVLAPPAASEPAHAGRLGGLAAKAIAVLDGTLGLPESGTRQVLEAWAGDPEAQLDLRTLYLRRVHRFCLYSVAWCADECDLLRRCGAAALRLQGESREGEAAWAKEHLRALHRFLAQAVDLPRPDPVPASMETEPLRARWEALCEESSREEGDGRHRCLRCSKLFKGRDYLQKHLLKSHHDGFCRFVLEARDRQMRDAYLTAQTGPGWW